MPSTNILLIHADQMRFDAMGCTGNPALPTPNLDELAKSGTLVSRHMVSNPVCMPSRSSMMTGLYPSTHGVWSNGIALNRKEYSKAEVMPGFDKDSVTYEPLTMADHFLANGYRTASFGKLHLTPEWSPAFYDYPESKSFGDRLSDWHGPYYGFEHVEITKAHNEIPRGHYGDWMEKHHPDLVQAAEENGDDKPIACIGDMYLSVLSRETHPSQWLADRCCEYITERKSQNEAFFAFVGIPDPHHAFIPLKEDLVALADRPVGQAVDPDGRLRPDLKGQGDDISEFSNEERDAMRRYTDAMVLTLDRAVGTMMDKLKELGLWESTIVAFTSDHGDYLCDHGRLRKSCRGAEQLLHVPCVIRDPQGRLPDTIDGATSNTDLFPTFCELTGLPTPDGMQGQSWLQSESQDRVVMSQAYSEGPKGTNLSVCDDRFRYGIFPATGQRELFDHHKDRLECHNLAEDPAHQDDVARLQRALEVMLPKVSHPIQGRSACW